MVGVGNVWLKLLSVIVWWRPDSDGGLLVLELQPRTGSIILHEMAFVYLFCFC